MIIKRKEKFIDSKTKIFFKYIIYTIMQMQEFGRNYLDDPDNPYDDIKKTMDILWKIKKEKYNFNNFLYTLKNYVYLYDKNKDVIIHYVLSEEYYEKIFKIVIKQEDFQKYNYNIENIIIKTIINNNKVLKVGDIYIDYGESQ